MPVLFFVKDYHINNPKYKIVVGISYDGLPFTMAMTDMSIEAFKFNKVNKKRGAEIHGIIRMKGIDDV